jgi:hypothetical protein
VAPHHHDAIRIAIRQRPQDHRVDDAENRRVGADAERERQQRDERKARLLDERANREAKVLEEGGHRIRQSSFWRLRRSFWWFH